MTAAESLRKSILVLELRQTEEGRLLKEQFSATYESLKPLNVIRKLISEVATPSELNDNIIQTVTGILSGYISRVMLVRSSKNPFLRLAGIFVQYFTTKYVTINSEALKAIALHYINKLTFMFQENKG